MTQIFASGRVRRSAQLRAIYAELRSNPDIEASAGDLLRLASFILRSFDPELDRIDGSDHPRGSRNLLFLPLDEAMSDGGWRILDFETHRDFTIDELAPLERAILEAHIQTYFGPQWRVTPRRAFDPPGT